MGGGREGQNWGQILNVILRNFHPYRLWNGQLFCLFVMQLKLDPGVPNPALVPDFLAPKWWGKNAITYYGFKHIFLKWANLPTNENDKKF